MPQIVGRLKARAARTILDLGCGSGRHVVYFAQQGFSVFGVDHSPAGIALTQQWLGREGLSATLRVHDITEPLPFEDAFFEAVNHFCLSALKLNRQDLEVMPS
jgi:SAM-dependent methyltransferase